MRVICLSDFFEYLMMLGSLSFRRATGFIAYSTLLTPVSTQFEERGALVTCTSFGLPQVSPSKLIRTLVAASLLFGVMLPRRVGTESEGWSGLSM